MFNRTNQEIRILLWKIRLLSQGSSRFSIGKNVTLGEHVDLNNDTNGRIIIADNCWIGDYVELITHHGSIQIGEGSFIGHFCVLYGHGGLKIGRGVMIAAHSIVIPANHNVDRLDLPIRAQGLDCRGIEIEDDCWIGSNVVVLDGVVIRQGAVVGAGAVVNSDVESNSIVVGNPARHVRYRGG